MGVANRTRKHKKISQSVEKQCYLLLLLPIIGFFVFTIYPILWAIFRSFYYYDQIPANTQWKGIENYIDIFTSNVKYWRSWLTTLKFMLYKLPFEIILTLVLAVFLCKKIKAVQTFRAIYFMPTIISVALSSVIFSNLFDYFGFFNNLFLKMHLISKPIDWFADYSSAMFVLVFGSVWGCFGINVLYFSAALTNVPDDLYEAAELDGATGLKKFIFITIPMIAPVFQTILLLAINGTLQTSEYVLVMTNGAPGGTTHTVGSYVLANYVPGFAEGSIDIGYGCAMSVINSIVYGGVAFIYQKVSAKMQNIY